jgi:4-amino-4-deoxy-L-arabinose transferase-like glycosyltransferase
VARSAFDVPLAIVTYSLIAVVTFFGLPLVLAALARARRTSPRDLPPVIKVLGVWILTVPLVFSLGGFISERYLLPIVPIVAVLVALGFSALDPQGRVLDRVTRVLLGLLSFVAAVMLALYVAIEFQLAPFWEAVFMLGLATLVLAFMLRSVRTAYKPAFVLPASLILIAALSFLPLRHLVMPHPGELLAQRLAATKVAPSGAVLIGGNELSAAVRLHAPHAEMFHEIENADDPGALDGICVVMTDKRDVAAALEQRGFSVEKLYGGWRKVRTGQLLTAVWQGRLADVLQEKAAFAFFATCPAG